MNDLPAGCEAQALVQEPPQLERLGLTEEQAASARRSVGPNAIRSHRTRPLVVLIRQLRSPLLALLMAAAVVSLLVAERTDAIVIAVIVTMSVGLGFVNEYRAERAVNALHDRLRHRALVHRDGHLV